MAEGSVCSNALLNVEKHFFLNWFALVLSPNRDFPGNGFSLGEQFRIFALNCETNLAAMFLGNSGVPQVIVLPQGGGVHAPNDPGILAVYQV